MNDPPISPSKAAKILFLVSFAVVSVGVFTFLNNVELSGGGATTWLGPPSEATDLLEKVRIVTNGPNQGGSLFDVSLGIPENSKELKSGEDLTVSVDLTNIGRIVEETGNVKATLNYIVTDRDNGNIVYLEHTIVDVGPQKQFLKSLDLQELSPGNYKVFGELVYEGKWAVASEEFKIKRWS